MVAFEESPFHPGEQKVQSKLGARDLGEKLGRAWHAKDISPSAAEFFAQQSLIYLASKNRDGRLWASVLAGPGGFLRTLNSHALEVKPLTRNPADPAELNVGDYIGTTTIVLETRQRERLNGRVALKDSCSLTVAVDQVFGGCPKYIQAREVDVIEDRLHEVSEAVSTSGDAALGEEQEQLIARADTLFLASIYDGPLDGTGGVQGCDISHRGGQPGFVTVTDHRLLRFADYIGNYTFTTLGNIEADPRASIIFVDFKSGDTLQLSGNCYILWEDRSLPGAQRVMQLETEKWVHTRRAIPLGPASDVSFSPYNPLPSCVYSADAEQERLQQLKNNYVDHESSPYFMARCLEVIDESHNVKTFRFEGTERQKKLKSGNVMCDPGQFASFDFPIISEGELINRTWTISSPQDEIPTKGTSSGCTFAVTIKRAGLVSNWMFENMSESRVIHFRGVDGDFTLERRLKPGTEPSVLLIAGGIGITPMRVLFHNCIVRGLAATLLYSVRTAEDAVFLPALQKKAAASKNAKVVVTFTKASESQETQEGKSAKTPRDLRDGQLLNGGSATEHVPEALTGHISTAMIAEVCPDFMTRQIFLCGPVPMMTAINAQLTETGFPTANLHKEVFNF